MSLASEYYSPREGLRKHPCCVLLTTKWRRLAERHKIYKIDIYAIIFVKMIELAEASKLCYDFKLEVWEEAARKNMRLC